MPSRVSSKKALQVILGDKTNSKESLSRTTKTKEIVIESSDDSLTGQQDVDRKNANDEIVTNSEYDDESDKENALIAVTSKPNKQPITTIRNEKRPKYTILSTDEDEEDPDWNTKNKKKTTVSTKARKKSKNTTKTSKKQTEAKKNNKSGKNERKRKKSDSFVTSSDYGESDEEETNSDEDDYDDDSDWDNKESKREEKVKFDKSNKKKKQSPNKSKKKKKTKSEEEQDDDDDEDENEDDDVIVGDMDDEDINDDDYDHDDEDEDYRRKKKNDSSFSDEPDDEVAELADDDNSKIKIINEEKFILDMFNDGSIDEIKMFIESRSEQKICSLISLRPFKDYEDLKHRTKQKNLSSFVESAEKILFARNKVNALLAKCEEISSGMKKLEKLCKHKYETDNLKVLNLGLVSQPKSLSKSMKLKPYQLVGLNWLVMMHEEKLNGILADEMGLGKTCQTIAFLAYLIEQQPNKKHLIIVPASTLENWSRELQTWLPSLNYRVYVGSLDERRKLRRDIMKKRSNNCINLILTTYSFVHSQPDDRKFFQQQLQFEYVVYDEAHMLKNMNTQRYKNLMQTRSKRRLLLTGTPLQNNLIELISLLYFVMPDVFHRKTKYLLQIFKSKPSDFDYVDTFYQEKIEQAKGIMRPFILRRLKSEVLKDLPDKLEEVVYCEMSENQRNAYNDMLEFFRQRISIKNKKMIEPSGAAAATKPLTRSSSSSTIVLSDNNEAANYINDMLARKFKNKRPNVPVELRLVANHPLLRRFIYTDDILKEMARLVMKESPPETVYEYVLEDLSVLSDYEGLKDFQLDSSHILSSGKFNELDKLLKEKKQSGDRILLFSQFLVMLDIIEEFLTFKKYKFIRLDGTTAVSNRQDLIDQYNQNEDIFIFLITTKAGGVGINLTSANVVILHDIDYNPFNDKQAQDRCHRVGQLREVQVYKFITKNSIEELMLRVQEKKLELGSEISGEKMLKEELQQMNLI